MFQCAEMKESHRFASIESFDAQDRRKNTWTMGETILNNVIQFVKQMQHSYAGISTYQMLESLHTLALS